MRQTLLWALFFAVFAGNIYFVSPAVAGFPIRFMVAIALLAILCVTFNPLFALALTQGRWMYLVISYLAIVGFALAAFRGDAAAAVQMFAADHLQAIVVFTVSMIGTMLIGRQSMTRAFVFAVGISVFFSVLQAAGFAPAMQVRDYLGVFNFQLQGDADAMADRNPGLSYSAIILGNQMCLAFAIVMVGVFMGGKRKLNNTPRPGIRLQGFVTIGAAIIAFAFCCLVQGNRSPLLGLAIFIVLLPSVRQRWLVVVLFPLLLVGLAFSGNIRDQFAGSNLRIASVGDKSEDARKPLMIYGWRLFENNPVGYGSTFDSKKLTDTVSTGDLAAMMSVGGLEDILKDRDLHNYWLSLLNVYGIFIIPVTLVVLVYGWRNWPITIAFLPYFVHVTFHNAAPLRGDYMFWVPAGIIAAGFRRKQPATHHVPVQPIPPQAVFG